MLPELSDQQQRRLEPVKRYALYVIGLLFVMSGLGYFAVYTYAGGVLMIAAGLFLFPAVRSSLETRLGVNITPLVALGVFGLLFLSSSAFALTAVDISQAPDIVVPFR
jgi:hypothetical protein